VNWKERKMVAADLKQVYHASTVEEAEQRLCEFEQKWNQKYSSIGQMWRRHWAGITPFFAFPAEIRRAVYTTNIVESLNMSLRKVIKTRGSFPSEEAALKLLYLALRNVSKKWNASRDWRVSLNHFTLLWGDRIETAQARPSR
jgi:putative transposase